MPAQTLAQPARHAVEIKHSRFLANAAPVPSAAAAQAFVAEVGAPDASHNAWAWRVGDEYRFHDDGEVTGTAGRPILSAIDGQGLDQVAVVVTRWYGGVKLGSGGLLRAYGGCAAECLRLAERRTLVEYRELTLCYPFAHTGAVHATLAQHGAEKLDEQFGHDGVCLHLRLPAEHCAALLAQLRDASRGQVRHRLR